MTKVELKEVSDMIETLYDEQFKDRKEVTRLTDNLISRAVKINTLENSLASYHNLIKGLEIIKP